MSATSPVRKQRKGVSDVQGMTLEICAEVTGVVGNISLERRVVAFFFGRSVEALQRRA
jgi:hypothetical protein